jgi:hemerythrin-like domain-containing protein
MQPIGPLMSEHLVIERMVARLKQHWNALQAGARTDIQLIDTAVDFFRTYADRTHHGKEEDLLFAQLAERSMNDELRATMDDLIAEHQKARELVDQLEKINRASADQDEKWGLQICLRDLVNLYQPHIEKEDEHFFRPAMELLSEDEQAEMLRAFKAFDADMIHEKYKSILEQVESGESIQSS